MGCVAALDRERDVVIPMIRNAGASHMMGLALEDGFSCYLATADSPSGGRDFHYGDIAKGVIQPVSHMGTSVPVAAGAALAFRNRSEGRVALTWDRRRGHPHRGLPRGDGVRGTGRSAADRRDPEQPGRARDPAGPARRRRDGGHSRGVRTCRAGVRRQQRAGCVRGRRRGEGAVPAGEGAGGHRRRDLPHGGHATHDEREARETFAPELFEHWGRRDPVGLFEAYLIDKGVPVEEIETVEARARRAVDAAAERALASRDQLPRPERALFPGISEGGVLHGLRDRVGDERPHGDGHARPPADAAPARSA